MHVRAFVGVRWSAPRQSIRPLSLLSSTSDLGCPPAFVAGVGTVGGDPLAGAGGGDADERTRESDRRGERGDPGRAGCPSRPRSRCCRAATEMWKFRVIVGRPATGLLSEPPSTPSTAWSGRSGRPGRSRPGARGDLVEVTRQPAPAVLRAGRWWPGVAVRGGGRLGAPHSSSSRMNDPRLGFGWNDVAFSGSSPPARATSTTRSRSTAGSRAAVTLPGAPGRARETAECA